MVQGTRAVSAGEGVVGWSPWTTASGASSPRSTSREIRGDDAHHVHFKLMAWIALDRALRLLLPSRLHLERHRGSEQRIRILPAGKTDTLRSFVVDRGCTPGGRTLSHGI